MHSIWSGYISFGLVNIPINLYSATMDHGLHFDLLRKKDHCKIRYLRICEEDKKEVPYEDIIKGFEYEDGNYIALTKEDFEKANVKKNREIQITQFVNETDIDSIFFDTPYFIAPKKGGEKTYALLLKALQETNKVGVGMFVLRSKENLVILKPYGNMLLLNKLRFMKDIRDVKDLNLPKLDMVAEAEVKIAKKLISQLTKTFKPKDFKDSYIEDLKKIIAAKAKGKKIHHIKSSVKKPEKTKDIMALLKKSLSKAS